MKKLLKLAIVAILLNLVHPYPAVSAVKTGAACSKVGSIAVQAGKKFTCVKSGKKLIWNKGVSLPKPVPTPTPSTSSAPANTEQATVAPTPTPSPTPTQKQETKPASQQYANPTEPSSSIEACKIKEDNNNRRNSAFQLPTGFPGTTSLATKTGTVKWALIPIDFPDMRGSANFRSRVDEQMKLVSEWFETVSEGKFKVEWVVANNWVTVPNPTSQYSIKQSMNLGDAPNGEKLFKDAMAAADPVFDFTNVQTVNFILPEGQKFVEESSQGFPWDKAVSELKLNEGKISSFAMPGTFFDQLNRQYWSYWVHEFGHAMGIPHIGSSRIANAYMNLDIMGNQDGFAKELSGWHRFVAGWLAEEKVYCQEFSKLGNPEVTLVPLSDTKNGIKMTVIQISNNRALVIESRRETKFACTMPSKKNGVLVYIYDATKSHGENYFIPVTPEGRRDEGSQNCPVTQYPDPLLYSNESIVVEGVKIQVLESKEYDRIRISKA